PRGGDRDGGHRLEGWGHHRRSKARSSFPAPSQEVRGTAQRDRRVGHPLPALSEGSGEPGSWRVRRLSQDREEGGAAPKRPPSQAGQPQAWRRAGNDPSHAPRPPYGRREDRSEEHTSELQSRQYLV